MGQFFTDILLLIFVEFLNKYACLLLMKMAKIKKHTFVAAYFHFKC